MLSLSRDALTCHRLLLGGDQAELGFHKGKWYWWTTLWAQPISQGEAEFAHEHHFRVWLEGEGLGVVASGNGNYYAEDIAGDTPWTIAKADTYLECQMRAVVEIAKEGQA